MRLSNNLKERLSSFWTLQLAGWLAYWVMIYVTFLTVVSSDRMLSLLHVKSVRTIIGFGLTCVLRLIYKPAARRQSFRLIAVLAFAGAIVFGCCWALLEDSYFWWWEGSTGNFFSWSRFPKVALDYAMTLLAWSALYFGIKYWRAWETERARTLQAHALAQQAQLEMLRYQLNPHFLFNALNSIRAFVTAFDAYAIRAFDVNALDYLLKPINPTRLAAAIARLTNSDAAPAVALRKLEYGDRLFLEINGRAQFLKLDQIVCLRAAGDYSEVIATDGKPAPALKSLKEWEERLPDNHFVRIHRSTIINLDFVEQIESHFNRSYQIHLRHLDEPLLVSRRYAAQLKQKFG